MACKNDITLAWGWLSLGALDAALVDLPPESVMNHEVPGAVGTQRDPADALDLLDQYLALASLSRRLR